MWGWGLKWRNIAGYRKINFELAFTHVLMLQTVEFTSFLNCYNFYDVWFYTKGGSRIYAEYLYAHFINIG